MATQRFGCHTYSLGKGSLKRRDNVVALDAVNIESLGPALEDTVVNVILRGGV